MDFALVMYLPCVATWISSNPRFVPANKAIAMGETMHRTTAPDENLLYMFNFQSPFRPAGFAGRTYWVHLHLECGMRVKQDADLCNLSCVASFRYNRPCKVLLAVPSCGLGVNKSPQPDSFLFSSLSKKRPVDAKIVWVFCYPKSISAIVHVVKFDEVSFAFTAWATDKSTAMTFVNDGDESHRTERCKSRIKPQGSCLIRLLLVNGISSACRPRLRVGNFVELTHNQCTICGQLHITGAHIFSSS